MADPIRIVSASVSFDAPRPGYSPPYMGKTDECMRLAVACVLGISTAHINYIDPSESSPEFWEKWRAEAARLGYRMTMHDFTWPLESQEDRLWIACVNTLGKWGEYHAVVMRGAKLHYDPMRIRKRKRKPTKIHFGIALKELPDDQ